MDLYILLFWRAAKMVFHVSLRYGACEPQIRVRVAEEEETFVRENKSGMRALLPASSFLPIMYAFLRPIVH